MFTLGALKPSGLGATGLKARYMDFIESLIDVDIAHDKKQAIRKTMKIEGLVT